MGECVRAKVAPLVFEHIVENVSNVLTSNLQLISMLMRRFVHCNSTRFFVRAEEEPDASENLAIK